MSDIVNGVLLDRSCVLLARRSDTRASYPGTWSFPGGHVEPGETLDRALTRELGEEIGVAPVSWQPLDQFTFRDGGATFHMFVIRRWRGTVANLGREHSALQWVSLDAAQQFAGLTFPIYADLFRALETA